MKMHGVILSEPNKEEVFIPRGNEVLHFIAQGIVDDSDFEKLCPRPIPPEIIKAGVGLVKNVEDENFKKELNTWAKRHTAWTIITSLKATPGLEWELVKYDDPTTWLAWEKEFDKIFTAAEIKRIIDAVLSANGMSEERFEKARQSFLLTASQTLQNGPNFLRAGQTNMPSGEHVNDSISILPK